MPNTAPITCMFFLITILLPSFLHGQSNQEMDFLQKVGAVDGLYSEALDEYREFYVQLPQDYQATTGKKYPVAFVLDGEVLLPAVTNVQSFYSGGFTPEMVLIGISNARRRIRDLTPSTITEKYGMPFSEETGGAENFSTFMEIELIPYVESKYPVTGFRTLIGHSYGGLFTIFTLLHHPHLFASYLAIDPSLDWDDQKLLEESREILSGEDYQGKSLFISLSGQLHMQDAEVTIDNVMQDTSDYTLFARSNIAFSDLVKKNGNNGLAFDWKFYPRDIHGTVAFPSMMDGLISLFTWFQMEHTDRINSFDTPQQELYDIVRYREKKLQDHFGYREPPYPEALLNMMGYMNMDMEQPAKAKMYFEFALEYFPDSANACDSMADYYLARGDIENAIKYVRKATALSDDDYYKKRLERLQNK